MQFKGTAHCYGRDIDTDVIIPARYLTTSDPAELAKHCLEDLDTSFVERVQPGDIIVADENFGCGSSREHAPIAIKAAGVDVVIAKSFARIFYRNSINTGLAIMECPEAVDAISRATWCRWMPIRASSWTRRRARRTRLSRSPRSSARSSKPAASSTARRRNLARSRSMTRTYNICLLPGDGIGPEIIAEGVKVLDAVGAKYDTAFSYTEALLGGCAIDACGTALPDETLRVAESSDAVLLAAVGGPKWDTTDPAKPRPEQGLLGIRKALGLYTNLRPVQIFAALADASTLKPEIVDGVDMMIVRELTGGLYFGRRERFYDEEGCGSDGAAGQRAYDTLEYREYEVERIARQAFEAARKRRNKVTSVDKANVLETSRMWREIVHRVGSEEYPDVELEDLLVDNTAMQLISRPVDFDVVVTENMFGDILSDEAAQITGSLGMLASASLGDGTALYEPSHGSAPDIAGRGIANPLAQILSVEMMLRYSFDMGEAADDIRRAVTAVLDEGWRTGDIKQSDTPADKLVGTAQMGDLVVSRL